MIVRRGAGLRTTAIARELGCHPQTVRERLMRCNAEGVDGFGDRPGPGRPPRLTEDERRQIVALARRPPLGRERRPGLCPQRSAIVARSTAPPEDRTVIGVDDLGPLIPRTSPPAPGWSPNGHRRKAPLDDRRGPEQVWVSGDLRPRDGHVLTRPGRARTTAGNQARLDAVAADTPTGARSLITDTRSRQQSPPIAAWLAEHPRVPPVFLPVGACWWNLQEGWWRWFRREAIAGQSFTDGEEIEPITGLATTTLHARTHPWVWGRTLPSPRHRRRRLVYRL